MIEHEKYRREFEERVKWLRNNVPRDDIYEFTEQTLLAAEYFLYKWKDHVNLLEEVKKDELTNKWCQNVIGLRLLQSQNKSFQVNTTMESI